MPSWANASMFGASGLDPKFCQMPAARQTVVYIDDTMMQSGNVSWVSDLENKLEATLLPGEKVTLVRLSPSSATTMELWSACWPDYPADQKARLSGGMFLFTSNPLTDLKNQQAIFIDEFLAKITSIYNATKDLPGEASVDGGHPRQKQIVEALSSDSARFTEDELTNRIIVYTDLAENSDLGSAFVPPPVPFPDIGQKLGLQFHNSIFYFFGAGADVSNAQGFLENAIAFWRQVLDATGGAMGGVGSNLSIPNTLPIVAARYVLDLDRHGQHLSGNLSLMADDEGNLVDSWISVTRLSVAALSGTFICQNQSCALHAKTNTGITILNVNENLDLLGSSSLITGTIGVPGSLTFPVTATSQH